MKLCFFLSNAYEAGGIQRSVSTLTKALTDTYNYEISILSIFKTKDISEYDYGNNCKLLSLFDSKFNLKRNLFRVRKRFNSLMSELCFDILIVEAAGLATIASKYIKNNKSILCEHVGYDNSKKFGLGWFGRRIGAKYANAIIVLTKTDLDKYKNNIKNIVYIDYIYNPIDSSIVKYPYNLKSKSIIACGRLSYEKGFDLLIKASKEVFSTNNDWQLDIYGDGPERSKLKELVVTYGISDNVHFKGYVNNIYTKYQDYSFMVVPSRFEGFGMVILEALKSGLPVISFDSPDGPKEILENNVNGILVKHLDLLSLRNEIISFIESPNLRQKIARNSDYNLERFNKNCIVDKWMSLFEKIYYTDK